MINADIIEKGRVVAERILTRWGLTEVQQKIVLPDEASYDELAIRISYLLNIHKALRILFNNPSNCYGFMKFINNSEPFQGQCPEVLLLTGQLTDLEKLYRHLDGVIH